jgi:hypothetical protein
MLPDQQVGGTQMSRSEMPVPMTKRFGDFIDPEARRDALLHHLGPIGQTRLGRLRRRASVSADDGERGDLISDPAVRAATSRSAK